MNNVKRQKLNHIRLKHKETIVKRFFNPIIYDSYCMTEQLKIIDKYYNEILNTI